MCAVPSRSAPSGYTFRSEGRREPDRAVHLTARRGRHGHACHGHPRRADARDRRKKALRRPFLLNRGIVTAWVAVTGAAMTLHKRGGLLLQRFR